jgi:hypothetical protein
LLGSQKKDTALQSAALNFIVKTVVQDFLSQKEPGQSVICPPHILKTADYLVHCSEPSFGEPRNAKLSVQKAEEL